MEIPPEILLPFVTEKTAEEFVRKYNRLDDCVHSAVEHMDHHNSLLHALLCQSVIPLGRFADAFTTAAFATYGLLLEQSRIDGKFLPQPDKDVMERFIEDLKRYKASDQIVNQAWAENRFLHDAIPDAPDWRECNLVLPKGMTPHKWSDLIGFYSREGLALCYGSLHAQAEVDVFNESLKD